MGVVVWVQNYVAYTAIDNNRPMLVCTQGGNKQTSIGRFACNEKEGTGLMLRWVCSCAHLFDVIDEGVRCAMKVEQQRNVFQAASGLRPSKNKYYFGGGIFVHGIELK